MQGQQKHQGFIYTGILKYLKKGGKDDFIALLVCSQSKSESFS